MATILHLKNRHNRRANHPKTPLVYLRVLEAEYIGDYRLNISFSDGTSQEVDFGPFLIQKPHPQYNKYRDMSVFQQFSIEMGNVVWGESWDLIFPVEELHRGQIEV